MAIADADFKYDNSARRDDDGQRPRFGHDCSMVVGDDPMRIFGSAQVSFTGNENRSFLPLKESNDALATGQQ